MEKVDELSCRYCLGEMYDLVGQVRRMTENLSAKDRNVWERELDRINNSTSRLLQFLDEMDQVEN